MIDKQADGLVERAKERARYCTQDAALIGELVARLAAVETALAAISVDERIPPWIRDLANAALEQAKS